MKHVDVALGGPLAGAEPFAAFRDLLAIVANAEAAQARSTALQAELVAIAEQRAALVAEREAFEAEKATAKAAMEEEREAAARLMGRASEEKLTAQSLREQAEAHAERVGYRERPGVVPMGTSGLTMTVFVDAPPKRLTEDPPASRLSDERFGPSTLTRQADDEHGPSAARQSIRRGFQR